VGIHGALQPDAGLLKFRAVDNKAYGNGNTNGMSVSMVRNFLNDGDTSGTISPKTMGVDRRQKYHEKFLRDMGIDPSFYVFTREAAEPSQLHYMTEEEIERFGLLTEDGCRR